MKIVARIVLGAVVLGFVAAIAAGLWVGLENRGLDGGSAERFQIPRGEALTTTARRLHDAELVRDPVVFRLFFQLSNGQGTFPSGTFEVPRGLSAMDLARWFETAQPLQVKVTIPEGWTASKIARLLEGQGIVSAKEFLALVQAPQQDGMPLEGRLFPDTYRFAVNSRPEDVLAVFLRAFREHTESWARSMDAHEFAQRLVLASIVEREYRAPQEAPLMASVFLNRLNRGIPLGSCATIEYILTEIQGRPHPKRIFIVHTQIPSPYNTYLNKGLPPTPISNPGMTALKAAFEPASTNYLYFVLADPEAGTHQFSSDFAQHERARETYLNTFVTKG